MKRKTISINEDVFNQLRGIKYTLSVSQGRELTWTELIAGLADMGQRSQEIGRAAIGWTEGVANRLNIPNVAVEEAIWRLIRGQSVWRIWRDHAGSLRNIWRIRKQLNRLNPSTFSRVLFSVFCGKSPDVQESYAKLGEEKPPDPEDEPQLVMPAGLSQHAFVTSEQHRAEWEGQTPEAEEEKAVVSPHKPSRQGGIPMPQPPGEEQEL